jgi:hypothetical protein
MIELSEALSLVEAAQSLEELRAIARSLSAEAIGIGGIVYSNEIDPTTKSGALAHSLAKTLGVPILDDTSRGKFLTSFQFQKAFDRLTATLTDAERANLATEFLYKAGGDSLWAEASRTYAATVRGDVFALTPNAADTFMMPAGAGNDTVTASANNGADTLRFDRWIAHDQLWFAQSGNNLVVSVIGQNQSVTVSNWYGAANNHLGKVLAGDGYAATDAGIQQLVEAMASFTPPAAGQTTLSPDLAASLAPTLTANWAHA